MRLNMRLQDGDITRYDGEYSTKVKAIISFGGVLVTKILTGI